MSTVDRLLTTLGRHQELRARELTEQLEVTTQVLSRLIAAAGGRVFRMGRARAIRYALTRSHTVLGTRVPVRRVTETGDIQDYGTLHLLREPSHWLERRDGVGRRFEGLPPFAADMSPQGYLGRSFTSNHPVLSLPKDIRYWSDEHRLTALALRGEDCSGDLIVGDESFNRFLSAPARPVRLDDYPQWARLSATGQPGSSAGGEQPKFTAQREREHVLVKFALTDDGEAARRWRDLLACEAVALESVAAAGFQAASARLLDIQGVRFLEVARFDRVGERGRKGLVSLGAITDEYFGDRDTWTLASRRLLKAGFIGEEDARRIRWLETFGELIGNTDQHFGNLSFFVDDPGAFVEETVPLRLAPIYDVLPMVFAPVAGAVVERPFTPPSPTADTFDVWRDAATHAVDYWTRLTTHPELSPGFREQAARCRDAVGALLARAP